MARLIRHGGGSSHGSQGRSHGGNAGHGGTQRRSNLPHGVAAAADFDRYKTTGDDWEGIRQAFHDTAVYPAAGTNQLTFFAVPAGQGSTYSGGGGTKTLSDTNMQSGGALPADQRFLMESIEVLFFPCFPAQAGFYPLEYHVAEATTADIVNDQWVFRNSGNLELTCASKPMLQEAPLLVFPAKTNFEFSGALSDTTTAGASGVSKALYANAKGRPYLIHPYAIGLDWGESFKVTLNWPEGVVAMPSGKAGLVRVRLDGILQRKA